MAATRENPPTNRTSSKPFISLLLVALVALVGVGLLLTRPHGPHNLRVSTAAVAASPTIRYVIGRINDYVTIYSSLGELKHAADIAVVGVVTRQAGTGYDNSPELFAYTDWTVSIVSVAYDKRHALASLKTITIRQSGGMVDGQQYVDAEDPLMKVGDRALFFLELDVLGATVKPKSALPYRGMNGAEGRFPSVNGLIARTAAGNIILAKPVTEAALVSQIQALSA